MGMEKQLVNKFPDGDRQGYYLRSASFALKHYMDEKGLESKVYVNKNELDDYCAYLTKKLYEFLLTKI